MSHILDITGIFKKLILLEHLVEGSEGYCAKRSVGSELDQGNEQYDDYWAWVKGIVCSYMIESSLKFRILQDTIKGEKDIIKLDNLDSEACEGLEIGKIVKGNFGISLREACNKIIHARHVTPNWSTKKLNSIEFQFWNGTVDLSGVKNSEPWEFRLYLGTWSQAMQRFFDAYSESSVYIGQDWY